MTDVSEQKIGDLIDSLGMRLDLADDDLVAGAVVLVKIVDADGGVGIGIANSEGCSWLEQLGLITAAEQVIRTSGPLELKDGD